MHKNFLCLKDCSADELNYLLRRAIKLKSRFKAGEVYRPFEGKVLAMLFEKASTRTRVSFEAGMAQLGGTSIYLNTSETQLKNEETIEDTARAVSRMVDLVMIRTGPHSRLEAFAKESEVPVINGLTDFAHPCQVLADLMTIRERKGSFKGLKLCFVGDGNNMANSLIVGGIKAGMAVRIACPAGYLPDAALMDWARKTGDFDCQPDVLGMAKGADVVYTDVWASMGQEGEAEERRAAFAGYQVNQAVMDVANAGAMVLHCLPAHRGEEITAEVLEAHADEIFEEAENRLHAQKAVLVRLLG